MGNTNIQDPILAAFLIARGVPLIEIVSVDDKTCAFILGEIPRQLLDEFLLERPPEKVAINAYRHLVRDAQEMLGRRGGKQ